MVVMYIRKKENLLTAQQMFEQIIHISRWIDASLATRISQCNVLSEQNACWNELIYSYLARIFIFITLSPI